MKKIGLLIPVIAVVIIGVSAWQGAGYQMLIFLAGLQNIPDSLYEAAELDGASRFQKMLNVTIPSILPIILVMFIL